MNNRGVVYFGYFRLEKTNYTPPRSSRDLTGKWDRGGGGTGSTVEFLETQGGQEFKFLR